MPLSSTRRSLLVAAIAMAAAMPVGAQVVTVRGTANGLPLPPVCQPPAGVPVSLLFSSGVLTATFVCDTAATPPALAVSCRPSAFGGVGSPIAVQYDVKAGGQTSEIFVDCPTAPTTAITNLDVEMVRYYPDLDAYIRNDNPTSLACRRSGAAAPGTVTKPSYDEATRILRYTCTVNGTPTEVGCFTWERDVPPLELAGRSRLVYAADNYTLRVPDCIGFGDPENLAANSPWVAAPAVTADLFADSFDPMIGATEVQITSFNPDPGVAGQPYTVNVAVTSESGTPAGAVLVSDGTGPLGNCVAMLSGTGDTATGSCPLEGVGPGGRTVRATYVGTTGLLGSTITRQYNVPRGTQTIIWNAPLTNPEPLVYSTGGTAALTATVQLSGGGAGGTLSYSVNAGSTACSVAGNTLTVLAATHDVNGNSLPSGPTCSITANASENASYDAPAPVSRSIAIRQAPQPITFNPPNPLPRFDPNGAFTATATRSDNSSGTPLSFTSLTSAICTTGAVNQSGNNFTVTVTMDDATRGVCRIRVRQFTSGNSNYAPGETITDIGIQPGLQVLSITRDPSGPITAGTQFTATVIGGKSGNPVNIDVPGPHCTIASQTPGVTPDLRNKIDLTMNAVSAGSCSIGADQDGNVDFEPSGLVEFVVPIISPPN
jgi:hypothetical protein